MSLTTSSAPPTRGHKKRERTRLLLLDAATDVLAARGDGFSLTELTDAAGVSHGTFYNYFDGRDELLAALVPHIVGQFAERMAADVSDDDAAVRFARISAAALAVAIEEPELVRVALRVDDVQRGLLADGPLSHLRQDLSDGFAAGRFACPPDTGTLDVLLGALRLAIRRIAGGEHTAAYRQSVLSRLLQSLGIDDTEAGQIATAAVGADGGRR